MLILRGSLGIWGSEEDSESYLAIIRENNSRVLNGELVVAKLVKFSGLKEWEGL